MARFNIMQVGINDHRRMYDELIEVVARSLIDLGHDCSVSFNDFPDGPINILVGASIFAARHFDLAKRLLGRPYIVYQLEQLDDANGLLADWPEYRDLLRNASRIWDYAPSSTAYLQSNGFSRVTYLPPGFHPCLESFRPAIEPDIDVMFVGTPHPRRVAMRDALIDAGINAAFVTDIYGAERNQIMARSKIVLNVHAWDGLNILETLRLSLALANRCFVISETGDHNPYDDGVVYADYDQLVSVCSDHLARPPGARDEVAARGNEALRKFDMIRLLGAIQPDLMEHAP